MRFFFHYQRGEDRVEDDDGVECSSLEEARREAVKAVRELAAERRSAGDANGIDEHLEVVAEDGQVVIIIPFKEVARVN